MANTIPAPAEFAGFSEMTHLGPMASPECQQKFQQGNNYRVSLSNTGTMISLVPIKVAAKAAFRLNACKTRDEQMIVLTEIRNKLS